MLRVRPGVELVRASLVPTSELITLDLPTLDRPRKAISGIDGAGKCAASVAAARKRDRTLMPKFAMPALRLASGVETPLAAVDENKNAGHPGVSRRSKRLLADAMCNHVDSGSSKEHQTTHFDRLPLSYASCVVELCPGLPEHLHYGKARRDCESRIGGHR